MADGRDPHPHDHHGVRSRSRRLRGDRAAPDARSDLRPRRARSLPGLYAREPRRRSARDPGGQRQQGHPRDAGQAVPDPRAMIEVTRTGVPPGLHFSRWHPICARGRHPTTGRVMSRAFVKEQDGADRSEELPDRPISPYPNFVTVEGLAQIEAALEQAQRQHAAALAANERGALARAARELRYWTERRTGGKLGPPRRETDELRCGSTDRKSTRLNSSHLG